MASMEPRMRHVRSGAPPFVLAFLLHVCASHALPRGLTAVHGGRSARLSDDPRHFGIHTAEMFGGNVSTADRLGLAVRYEHLAYLIAQIEKEKTRLRRLEVDGNLHFSKLHGERKHYIGWEGTSDEWWVDALKRDANWATSDNVQGVPGTYALSELSSYSCMLVVKDACHFNYDRDDGSFGGYWYSQHGHDLSKLWESKDVCGWSKRFNVEPTREVARKRFKFGEFLSPRNYANLTIPRNGISTKDIPVWNLDQVLVSPQDSFPGHFIESVGPLAELAASLAKALNRPSGEAIFANLTIQFGTNYWVRTFARGVTKILFGDLTRLMVGKRRPGNAHACYKEAIFPLNDQFVGGAGSERFKENAYKLVTESYVGVHVPPKVEPNYQVTWLWRSGKRSIVNAADVLRLLESVFRGIPIQMLEFGNRQPLVEVIDTMRRTAFTFGMHGASFANEIFLPSGSIALELLPWKMEYHYYRNIGTLFGVEWEQWRNKYFENTSFGKQCFNSSWMEWTAEECLASTVCYHCIKNHSNTLVDLRELEAVLRAIEPRVRDWIAARQEVARPPS